MDECWDSAPGDPGLEWLVLRDGGEDPPFCWSKEGECGARTEGRVALLGRFFEGFWHLKCIYSLEV